MRTRETKFSSVQNRDFYRGKSVRVVGKWSEKATYYNDDFVTDLVAYDNSLYACLKTNSGKNPSDANSVQYWTAIVNSPKVEFDENTLKLYIINDDVKTEVWDFSYWRIDPNTGHLMMNERDLGNVSALHVGENPPAEEEKLWYDTSENTQPMTFADFFREGYNSVRQIYRSIDSLRKILISMEEGADKVPEIELQIANIHAELGTLEGSINVHANAISTLEQSIIHCNESISQTHQSISNITQEVEEVKTCTKTLQSQITSNTQTIVNQGTSLASLQQDHSNLRQDHQEIQDTLLSLGIAQQQINDRVTTIEEGVPEIYIGSEAPTDSSVQLWIEINK